MEKTEIIKQLDRLETDKRWLKRTMKSISPKLAIYSHYQRQLDSMATKIGNLKVELKK